MIDPWRGWRSSHIDDRHILNADLGRPTLVLLLAPSTRSPTRLLIHELRAALLSVDRRAALRVTTDHTRNVGSGFRLYGSWHRPAAAHAALILLFSTHLEYLEEHLDGSDHH